MRLIDADALKVAHGMKDDCADCDRELRGKSRSCEFDRIYSLMDFCGWLDDAPTIEPESCENAASRQAAIDTIDKYIAEFDAMDANFLDGLKTAKQLIKDSFSVIPEPCEDAQHILDYLDNVLYPLVSPEHWNVYSELHDMIAALPSAQPEHNPDDERKIADLHKMVNYLLSRLEQRWIPCSERLPEANGRYLVTRGLNACGAMWNRVYIINYSDLMGLKSDRIWWDGNVGKSDFERIDDVIAWMPPPEPYREEGDE